MQAQRVAGAAAQPAAPDMGRYRHPSPPLPPSSSARHSLPGTGAGSLPVSPFRDFCTPPSPAVTGRGGTLGLSRHLEHLWRRRRRQRDAGGPGGDCALLRPGAGAVWPVRGFQAAVVAAGLLPPQDEHRAVHLLPPYHPSDPSGLR